jgi:hypothetical protein
MKGKKTSIEDKAKVIEAKINNPNISARDIEEETGVNYRTTARILDNDLSQVVTESKATAELIDRNNNLLAEADKLIAKKIQQTPDEVRVNELVAVKKSTFEQNRLIQGESTENVNIGSNLTKEQMDKLHKLYADGK